MIRAMAVGTVSAETLAVLAVAVVRLFAILIDRRRRRQTRQMTRRRHKSKRIRDLTDTELIHEVSIALVELKLRGELNGLVVRWERLAAEYEARNALGPGIRAQGCLCEACCSVWPDGETGIRHLPTPNA